MRRGDDRRRPTMSVCRRRRLHHDLGADRAEAPGLFSTKNGWSQRGLRLGGASAPRCPPAAGVNGTTIRTGAWSPCASANGETAAAASAHSTRRRDCAGFRVMRTISSGGSEDYKGRRLAARPARPHAWNVASGAFSRKCARATAPRLGPLGHDVRDGFGDLFVGSSYSVSLTGAEKPSSVTKSSSRGRRRRCSRAGCAVLERKAAEIREAAEHRPDTGREFRFDAAECGFRFTICRIFRFRPKR